ncbi:MAG: hypothetical protein VW576_03565 [Opitutae bacterium]
MFYQFFQVSLCLLLFLSLLGCKTSPNAKLDFSDGSYEGGVNKKGEKQGTGIYRWLDGSIYEGDYLHDLRHGQGKFLWANGESYKGDYLKDNRTGKGVYDWPDGSSYEGDFLSGKRHGKGRYQSADGTVYEGEWFDDFQHGQGTLHYTDGRKLKGIWRQGSLVAKPAALPTTSQKPKLPKVSLGDEIDTNPSGNAAEKSVELVEEQDPLQPDSSLTPDSAVPVFAPDSSLPADNPAQNSSVIETANESVSPTPVPEASTDEAIEDENESPGNQSNEKDTKSGDPDWTGTVAEAEAFFITDLVDGIDTVRLRTTGIPFSGRMRIVNSSGQAQGEVNLLKGRMHGEEIFYDDSGEVVERNFWANGHPIGQ